jgi:hypothetical protein
MFPGPRAGSSTVRAPSLYLGNQLQVQFLPGLLGGTMDDEYPDGDDMMPPVDLVRPELWENPGQWGDDIEEIQLAGISPRPSGKVRE